jgi:hypothetical protein
MRSHPCAGALRESKPHIAAFAQVGVAGLDPDDKRTRRRVLGDDGRVPRFGESRRGVVDVENANVNLNVEIAKKNKKMMCAAITKTHLCRRRPLVWATVGHVRRNQAQRVKVLSLAIQV